jgi:hypothetical protein
MRIWGKWEKKLNLAKWKLSPHLVPCKKSRRPQFIPWEHGEKRRWPAKKRRRHVWSARSETPRKGIRSGASGCLQGTCPSETCRRSDEAAQGPACSRNPPRSAGGKDPGKLWIPEEIGHCRQKDDPPCRSGTAQGTRSWRTVCRTGKTEESDQGQSCKKNPERRTIGRRQLTRQEGINGTKNRDFNEQLRVGSERTSNGIYRKTSGLEIAKRIAGSSVRLRRMRNWTLWRGRLPPKQKKR